MTLLRVVEQTFCTLHKPTQKQLKSALQSLGHLIYTVPDYTSEPQQLPYGRNFLFYNNELEVIVVHIPAGISTAIHNHGSSIGVAYLVEGMLTNTIYTLDSYGYPIPQQGNLIHAGHYFEMPTEQIHRLSNPFHERAISLHVYTPPLHNVSSFLPYSEVLDYVI